mgnify:CR=1 FL=1
MLCFDQSCILVTPCGDNRPLKIADGINQGLVFFGLRRLIKQDVEDDALGTGFSQRIGQLCHKAPINGRAIGKLDQRFFVKDNDGDVFVLFSCMGLNAHAKGIIDHRLHGAELPSHRENAQRRRCRDNRNNHTVQIPFVSLEAG